MSVLFVAAAVAAFNLECAVTGTTTSGPMTFGRKPTSEWHAAKTLRIDLDAGRWCEGDCKETAPIVGMSETVLLLKGSDSSDADKFMDNETYINRETGEFVFRSRMGSLENLLVIMVRGPCRRLPFTGFPTKLF